MVTSLLSEVITDMDEITPTRSLNLLYIILDSIFIVILMALFIWQKRYQTAIFAFIGGIIYVIVDYCGFYLISGTRTVYINGVEADALHTFWVLLWMSMSYGITNFAFMWTCINKDKLAKYWIFLIIVWWLIAPSISELGGDATITTQRTTGAYHGWMGVVMIVSYLILAIILLWKKKPFISLLYLFVIGFFVQFGWEFSLLINGIRPMNDMSLQTLIVNSCLETNLGMPAAYLIWWFVRRYRYEDMTKVIRSKPVQGGVQIPVSGSVAADAAADASLDAQAAVAAPAAEIPALSQVALDTPGWSPETSVWKNIQAIFSGRKKDAKNCSKDDRDKDSKDE
ncbi:MAG: hypothetical protein LUD51_02235 [Clostridia bacterium]|nr:hypothetical protein [Clostridia bacterium]